MAPPMTPTIDRSNMLRDCRELRIACIRLGRNDFAQWAHEWANALLDSRRDHKLIGEWIEQLRLWVGRREKLG